MQSHRTLEDDSQVLEILKTCREEQIPLAVICLGTGFIPRRWNTTQPSFELVTKRVFRLMLLPEGTVKKVTWRRADADEVLMSPSRRGAGRKRVVLEARRERPSSRTAQRGN